MKSKIYTRRQLLWAGLGLGAAATAGGLLIEPLRSMLSEARTMPNMANSERMPAIFVGHGTPMSAIEPNQWTKSWGELGKRLPKPSAILTISAHWLTRGSSLVTASEAPPMNYDMYGFPPALYEVKYPAPGNKQLATEVAGALSSRLPVNGDTTWGFDHATWVVLKYMFPEADIPVIQLSIDYSKPPEFHYELAKELQFLRSKGVLVFGSGNVVHNLRMRPGMNNDQPFDWAVEFDSTIWKRIQDGDYRAVADFQKLGSAASLSHPSYDHFLPLLYTLGVKTEKDEITTFNDNFQWPAVSMRSFLIA
jgi:4,5-DOPA dioxygenase extradiol